MVLDDCLGRNEFEAYTKRAEHHLFMYPAFEAYLRIVWKHPRLDEFRARVSRFLVPYDKAEHLVGPAFFKVIDYRD